MSSKNTVIALVLILAGVGVVLFWINSFHFGAGEPGPVACTMEAKQCPDGSYVGRTGPKCEFAPCPPVASCEGGPCPVAGTKGTGGEGSGSGISGTALLGPTCPVERIPPDPRCAPRPYQGKLAVMTLDGTELVAKITTDTNGKFFAAVPSGEYSIQTDGSNFYPRCGTSGPVTVAPDKITDVKVSCDTGIR